jgi:hypothetical protein
MLPIMMVVIYGMIATSDAVILHGRDYGDTSRIVVAYTEGHGMVSALAKGIRKPGNAMSGALESMQESVLTMYLKPGRDLQLVRSADLLCKRERVHRLYDYVVAGMAVCDVVMRTQVVGAMNTEVWHVVRDGLRSIDGGDRPWLDSVATRLALARVMGFGVPLAGDVGNGVAIGVRLADGVVMSEGYATGGGVMRMSTAAWRCIEAANGGTLPMNESAVVPADRNEVEAFLRLYVGHHIERSVGLGLRVLFG